MRTYIWMYVRMYVMLAFIVNDTEVCCYCVIRLIASHRWLDTLGTLSTRPVLSQLMLSTRIFCFRINVLTQTAASSRQKMQESSYRGRKRGINRNRCTSIIHYIHISKLDGWMDGWMWKSITTPFGFAVITLIRKSYREAWLRMRREVSRPDDLRRLTRSCFLILVGGLSWICLVVFYRKRNIVLLLRLFITFNSNYANVNKIE